MKIVAKTAPRAIKAIQGVERSLRRVIVAAGADLWNDLVSGTPVDTGFARASWWIANDGQRAVATPAPGGEAYAAPAQPVAALMASPGKLTTFANGAVYIRKLEYGHSPQAPNGWVRAAAARYPVHLRKRIAQEKALLAKAGDE